MAPAGSPGCRARARAAGILTDYPCLTDLDRDDNLKVTVDFRKVYASLIEGWLGTERRRGDPERRRLRAAGARALSDRRPGRRRVPGRRPRRRRARETASAIYRATVAAGAVRFNVHDFGEDAHNLMVFGPNGYRGLARRRARADARRDRPAQAPGQLPPSACRLR